jgi:hypothetical protein
LCDALPQAIALFEQCALLDALQCNKEQPIAMTLSEAEFNKCRFRTYEFDSVVFKPHFSESTPITVPRTLTSWLTTDGSDQRERQRVLRASIRASCNANE